MAITPDQQAMLELLLARGQGYDDLAALLAVDQTEVRRRARAALTELGGADPDRSVALTDYLLGQADPIGRADASRHLRTDASDHALATTLVERLRELIPGADLPRLPGEPRRSRPRGAASQRTSTGGLSRSQTRVLVALAGAAALIVVLVLAVTGTFSGDDDPGAATASTGDAGTTSTATTDQPLQRIALEPVTGGDAGGEAIFGLTGGDQAYVEIAVDGLDPAPRGQAYVIWLMLTPSKGYPLSPLTASQQGTFSDRFPIPASALGVVARARLVDVSISSVGEIRKLVRGAIQETTLVLDKPGETILQGRIPRGSAQPEGGG